MTEYTSPVRAFQSLEYTIYWSGPVKFANHCQLLDLVKRCRFCAKSDLLTCSNRGSEMGGEMTFVRGVPTCGELAGLWGASGQMKLPRGKTKATNEDEHGICWSFSRRFWNLWPKPDSFPKFQNSNPTITGLRIPLCPNHQYIRSLYH